MGNINEIQHCQTELSLSVDNTSGAFRAILKTWLKHNFDVTQEGIDNLQEVYLQLQQFLGKHLEEENLKSLQKFYWDIACLKDCESIIDGYEESLKEIG
tara:strand:- start:98 stop:394 length:297 start_codon:yes stop_codon:yes gene_type:complete